MKFTKALVLQVNELYHDIEGALYDDKHNDIFDGELNRWDEIGKQFLLVRDKGSVLLDIGTGTGFVPLVLAPYLSQGDVFICSDISQNILNAAERNINKAGHSCQFQFLKMNGDTFTTIKDASVDFITINSVMHHLPDFQSFFSEMNRVVKKGGRIFIGHEPNQSFFRNYFLWKNYELISYFFNPSKLIYNIVCFFGLLPLAKKVLKKDSVIVSGEYQAMVDKINEKLIAKGTISRALTETEISQLIDFQSPTAGKLDIDKGIDMSSLLKKYGKNFSFELYDTYNHVYRISNKNKLIRWYSGFLFRFFPQSGAAFFAVLKKDA